MVAVVEAAVQNGLETVERLAFDALCLKLFLIVFRQRQDAPHVVIDDPDVDAGPDLFFQQREDRIHILPGAMMKYSRKMNFSAFFISSSILTNMVSPNPKYSVSVWVKTGERAAVSMYLDWRAALRSTFSRVSQRDAIVK
jgi:hypothetical protein